MKPDSTPDGGAGGDSTVPEGSAAAANRTFVQRFRLKVVAGPDTGKTLQSSGERTVIGKHESADLVLSDVTVSRFHCEVVVKDGRASLRDLGSRNGTGLNNVDVVQAYLRDGSTITVGGTQLRFELGNDLVALPLSENRHFGVLVGKAPNMRGVFALLERAAGTDATVLIEGETGTGKEGVAESLHRESARRQGPFIVVDAGAVPPDLLESELFGHERGSFTGALTAREGAFEAANGGTIFLDEIGELGADLQPKLLRALERREIKRVGSNRYVPVDVRVIAATNRNLRAEVNESRFRSDLFYRLAVITVRLPPLRDRVEDIPLLVDHILTHLGVAGDEAAALRTPGFMERLAEHPWPGNVRELRNYLERCLALREQMPIDESPSDAAPAIDVRQTLRSAREACVRAFEHRYLAALLRAHDNNVSAAARAADIDRPYLYRLLARHQLR